MKNTTKTPQQVLPSSLPKRKPGRPRKATPATPEHRPKSGRTAKTADKPRSTNRRSGTSTREMIITSANEIINRTGVVDFRIEMLAETLQLSPGNITYHFSRKEEIISAIWEEYLALLRDTAADILTPLLDLKQWFLFFRTVALKAVTYAGVTSYYFGDMGPLLRENESLRRQIGRGRELVLAGYDTLARNGYLHPIEDPQFRELTFESQTLVLRWWLNHAQTCHPRTELATAADRYIALSLLPLHPYLTEPGKRQFDSIINLIK